MRAPGMAGHELLDALQESDASVSFPIIDTHIHLFPETHLPNMNWYTPGGPLSKQHSVSDYKKAAEGAPFPPHGRFKGFVFVETDRKFTVSGEDGGWVQPIEELKFLGRIHNGTPIEGEGHSEADRDLCLAIVGWAPVPGGRVTMEKYVQQVREAVGESAMKKIVAWRYLVQNKPPGTMLTEEFVDSLKWMGENGYAFDLGVDMRSGGLWQMSEAASLLSKVTTNVPVEKQVKIVMNHMCKPDMQGAPYAPTLFKPDHQSFVIWQKHVKVMAAFPNTYMKLSGALSEMPPLPSEDEQSEMSFWNRQQLLLDATEHARSWLSASIELFGADRVMFGSDWPVCNVGGGGNGVAFKNWVTIIRGVASKLVDSKAYEDLWGGTAARVYKISIEKGSQSTLLKNASL